MLVKVIFKHLRKRHVSTGGEINYKIINSLPIDLTTKQNKIIDRDSRKEINILVPDSHVMLLDFFMRTKPEIVYLLVY